MTPRKEIFIQMRDVLNASGSFELVDWNKKQFSNPKENYPTYWTAVLIAVKAIRWENMTNDRQEGVCTVEATLYCKDGWTDSFNGTSDADTGLAEIDLIDTLVEKLEGLKGNSFTPLELSEETADDEDNTIMSYTLTFTTNIYRTISPKYKKRKLTLNP
ncbi:hypothetical protein BWK59_06405 [Flavobacterium davisii]|uniref:Uncharacterized protein n=1 Tax=Flavobacterium davisii TaxID=2906077 RepID=A0A246GJ03_9FLAO|nr:hypothetical protein [Flavobacterium davisii]OWP84218.1 hypothetical protein BWK59_06405 [Flavobacterium davisii]